MDYEQGKIDKGWGFEIVFANNSDYCGKLLVFPKVGAKTSMVLHKKRRKTWWVNEGKFKLTYIEVTTGKVFESVLEAGKTVTLSELAPHQVEALEPNSVIFEVSTGDEGPIDRIRLAPGDSQTKPLEQQ
jgi:hypothetical protein